MTEKENSVAHWTLEVEQKRDAVQSAKRKRHFDFTALNAEFKKAEMEFASKREALEADFRKTEFALKHAIQSLDYAVDQAEKNFDE